MLEYCKRRNAFYKNIEETEEYDMKSYEELVALFNKANENFLCDDLSLIESCVSERTLCGALMLHMHDLIVSDPSFKGYYTDVEYNRNKGGKVKNIKKTILGIDEKIVTINCDLILHSRGCHAEQDNLIAIEMKKSSRPKSEKHTDRERLMALTKNANEGVYPYDGHTSPQYVCGYVLGVYYEINYNKKSIKIEFYRYGTLDSTYEISYNADELKNNGL